MKTTFLALMAGLFISSAQAADTDGVFRFTSPQTPQSFQEATTIVKTVAQVAQVAVNEEKASMAFHGTAENLAVAVWALGVLDTGSETGAYELKTASGEIARVNFLQNVQSRQATQEMLTNLRNVADIARIFNFTSRRAVVLRGKETQIALAEWLLDQLNQPPAPAVDAAYPGITEWGYTVRVDYLDPAADTLYIQEILTVVRTAANIAKAFNYTPRHALAFRASQSDVALTDWLIHQLNEPQSPGDHEFAAPYGDDLTRVFFKPNALPADLKSAFETLRTSGLTKCFTVTKPHAIVVRGTADQIKTASKLLGT